jgi:hypothetical protein
VKSIPSAITMYVTATPQTRWIPARARLGACRMQNPAFLPGQCAYYDKKMEILFVNDFGLVPPYGMRAKIQLIAPGTGKPLQPGMCFTSQKGAAALMALKPDVVRHMIAAGAKLPFIWVDERKPERDRVAAYALVDLAPWLRSNMTKIRPVDLVECKAEILLAERFT